MPLFFIARKYKGSDLTFNQIDTPKTSCECCGQRLSGPMLGSPGVYKIDGVCYTLTSYGRPWFEFESKEAARFWLGRIKPFYPSTIAPHADSFMVMTPEEYAEYIKPSKETLARGKGLLRRELLRVWKLIGQAPRFPNTQEAGAFNCQTDWQWVRFKGMFDSKYGKAA